MAKDAKKQTPLEKARARYEEMQNNKGGGGGGGKTNNFLSLVPGKNVVRVLPGKDANSDDYYVETAYHYKLGPKQKTVECPSFIGKQCPACDKSARARKEAYRLKNDGAEEDPKRKKQMDKLFKVSKNLKAKSRFFLNVIPLAAGKQEFDGKQVKILACGPQIMNGIFKHTTDTEEFGDVLDLKSGRDMIISKKGEELDTEYEVTLRDKDRCTKVHPNRLKDLNDLSEIVGKYPKASEIEAIMEGNESSDEGDDEEEDEDKPAKKKPGKGNRFKGKKGDEDEEEDEDDESSEEEDEDEEDEEESKPKKKAKPTKKKPTKDEDEEEEDDDDDEEDDEDDDDSDDEDEEDDEEDGEDDDEDGDDDEDDDDDAGDDEDEDDEEEDDEEESDSARSKLKKKLAAKKKGKK